MPDKFFNREGEKTMGWDFKATVTDLADVPDFVKSLYTKVDGKDVYTIHADFTTHVGGLTSALDKERKANKAAKDGIAAWTGLGLGETPDEAKTKVEDLTKTATENKDGKVNWDKMKADLETGHAKALKVKDDQVTSMQTTLERHLIDNVAITALTEAKGAPTLLLPHIRSQVKVVKGDNGEYVVRVVDKDGDPRGDDKGGFMTIKDLIAQMKASTEFGRAFEATGQTGSGKQPGSSKAGKEGGAGRDTSELSPTQKISLGLQKGQLSRAG